PATPTRRASRDLTPGRCERLARWAGAGFAHQAPQGAQVEQEIADVDLLRGARCAVGRQAFESQPVDLAVATLREIAPPIAGLPGGRPVGDLPRQATRAVREGAPQVHGVPTGIGRFQIGTATTGW